MWITWTILCMKIEGEHKMDDSKRYTTFHNVRLDEMDDVILEILNEEMQPDEYKEDAKKSTEYFNTEMKKIFPKFFAIGKLVSIVGTDTSCVFNFANISPEEVKSSSVAFHNAEYGGKFMMHLATSGNGNHGPKSKFEIENLTMGKVKFRKITGKSPTDAVKKLVDWFKKNKDTFSGGVNESLEEGNTENTLHYKVVNTDPKTGKETIMHFDKGAMRKINIYVNLWKKVGHYVEVFDKKGKLISTTKSQGPQIVIRVKGKVVASFDEKDEQKARDEWNKQIDKNGGIEAAGKNVTATMESVESDVESLDESMANSARLTIFNKLKKGSVVKIKYQEAPKVYKELKVTAKNMVAKGKVEKITMVPVEKTWGVKYFMYRYTDDDRVSFAIGDMAALPLDIQESLDEAKNSYDLYHKDYSSAVHHALETLKKRGYEVVDDDFQTKVSSGPRKPSEGKTNSFSIEITKDGKPVKNKALQMQIYNKGGSKPYELNMYVESIDVIDRALMLLDENLNA
jgi:hypothetical protein